jgi:ribonuclease J
MGIEIRTVGGYNEVGKNMTAIRIDDTVLILDMGIHLERYIKLTEEEDLVKFSVQDFTEAGAVPDISMIDDWQSLVQGIIPTHAHLDHVGAIPFLANKFSSPIFCTPFTAEVINSILKDEKIKLKNEIKRINVNSTFTLNNDIKIEFINSTHSTPQTVIAAIHTPYGVILYANDFKFDMYPSLGKQPNLNRLTKLGKSRNVTHLIVDSTNAPDYQKTFSESVAKQMLKDVLLGTNSDKKLVLVTTFSSHLARLQAVIDYGKRMKRKIVFLGRSLAKYVEAGERAGIINFTKDIELVKYSKHIKSKLKMITKNRQERGKHLIVVTGHQGEPKSVLSRMVDGQFDMTLEPEDHVIFSCRVIPTETNIKNREMLEEKLKKIGVRMFKNIHVSGHASREDLRDLIKLVKPKNVIPAHGNFQMTSALVDLLNEMGYAPENIHLMQNGDRLKFN